MTLSISNIQFQNKKINSDIRTRPIINIPPISQDYVTSFPMTIYEGNYELLERPTKFYDYQNISNTFTYYLVKYINTFSLELSESLIPYLNYEILFKPVSKTAELSSPLFCPRRATFYYLEFYSGKGIPYFKNYLSGNLYGSNGTVYFMNNNFLDSTFAYYQTRPFWLGPTMPGPAFPGYYSWDTWDRAGYEDYDTWFNVSSRPYYLDTATRLQPAAPRYRYQYLKKDFLYPTLYNNAIPNNKMDIWNMNDGASLSPNSVSNTYLLRITKSALFKDLCTVPTKRVYYSNPHQRIWKYASPYSYGYSSWEMAALATTNTYNEWNPTTVDVYAKVIIYIKNPGFYKTKHDLIKFNE